MSMEVDKKIRSDIDSILAMHGELKKLQLETIIPVVTAMVMAWRAGYATKEIELDRWFPIEEAPHDRLIFAQYDYGSVSIARWIDSEISGGHFERIQDQIGGRREYTPHLDRYTTPVFWKPLQF